jgi:hypothetical protein
MQSAPLPYPAPHTCPTCGAPLQELPALCQSCQSLVPSRPPGGAKRSPLTTVMRSLGLVASIVIVMTSVFLCYSQASLGLAGPKYVVLFLTLFSLGMSGCFWYLLTMTQGRKR